MSFASRATTSRSHERHGVRMLRQRERRKYDSSTPRPPPISVQIVSTKLECFCKKSGGSSQPLLTHDIGHTISIERAGARAWVGGVYHGSNILSIDCWYCASSGDCFLRARGSTTSTSLASDSLALFTSVTTTLRAGFRALFLRLLSKGALHFLLLPLE